MATTVEQALQRVTELEREQAALEAAWRTLAQEHIDANQGLARVQAVAERTPTPQNTRAANQAEASTRALGIQVQRKRAALEACEVDLAVAQNDVQLATRAAAVVTLEGLTAELTGLATELEQNILRADLWERVVDICTLGDALYRQVKPAETPWRNGMFADLTRVSGVTVQRLAATMGAAIDINKRRQRPVEVATVADALELPRLQQEIANLRRLHVEPLAQRSPALEAAPS